MKLHWSTRSPFVRKVVVVAHELGLAGRIECIRTAVAFHSSNDELMRDNPLSKIPTLIRDDGRPLYDSIVISEYLDMLVGGGRLFPIEKEARFEALRRHALGNGLLDLSIIRRNEQLRPAERRSAEHLAAFEKKTKSALDHMEREATALSALPFDIGHVGIGCALSYLDFRYDAEPWRPGRPRLAAWHETFSQRPSVIATKHIDS